MLAALLLLALGSIEPGSQSARGAVPNLMVAQDASLTKSLRGTLMHKFDAMNAAGQGIFHDDMSAVVAPYFPPGQSFADTEKIIAQQKLGTLEMFKGTQNPADGTMYVTTFSLMSGMFSDISVVLNFDFAGKTKADMVIKKTSAYIRAAHM